MVDVELKRLRKQIAREREKLARQQEIVRTSEEKRKLRRELVLLQSPTKRGISKLSRRFGRGVRKTSKIVGKALLKQARLIQEQQERERIAGRKLETVRIKSGRKQPKIIFIKKPKSFKKGKKRKKQRITPRREEVGMFGNLDF